MKKVVKVLIVIIVAFVGVGLILPGEYTASTTYDFKHSKAAVHGILSDLSSWDQWGPWMKDDPNMKIELQGEGVGAKQIWTSRKAGNGSLTFTKVDSETGIAYDLNFDGYPPANASFEYSDVDGGVRVKWTMNGKMDMPVVGGYLALFFKTMIANSFEQGMKNIDELVEHASREH